MAQACYCAVSHKLTEARSFEIRKVGQRYEYVSSARVSGLD